MKQYLLLLSIVWCAGVAAQEVQFADSGGASVPVQSAFNIHSIAFEVFPTNSLPAEHNWWGNTGAAYVVEYLWSYDVGRVSFSGFGFGEARNRYGDFTNHSWNAGLMAFPLLLTMEQGGAKGLGYFNQIGLKAMPANIPVLGSLVKPLVNFAAVAYYVQIIGDRQRNELLIAWSSKAITVQGVSLRTDGFYRFRSGGRADFGQPQAWLYLAGYPGVRVGVEAEMVGGNPLWQFGLKIDAIQLLNNN